MNAERTPTPPQTGRYVDVAVDTQAADRHRLFTYAVPAFLAHRIVERQLVWVPLRRELKLAITVRRHDAEPAFTVRDVHAPVEPEFCFSPRQWELLEWMSQSTICSLFDAASPFLPPGVGQRSVEYIRLRAGVDPTTLQLPALQRQLVDLLVERDEVSVEVARRVLGRGLTTVIPRLDEAGVIERTAKVRNRPIKLPTSRYVRLVPRVDLDLRRAPAQRRALEVVRRRSRLTGDRALVWDDLVRRTGVTAQALRALQQRGAIEVVEAPRPASPVALAGAQPARVQLTPLQSNVWRHLLAALRSGRSDEYLLHGITGSGKTEIYLRATAWALSHGRQVIMLVPEITLATQVVDRFTERFPGQVGVLHSGLPDSERYQTWKSIAAGNIPLVVGPRSALFAPLQRVGLIIMDEEHEAAYKQDSPPRYHARDAARQVARLHDALLLLGSATPDVTTYHAAKSGQIGLLELPERVGPALLAGPSGEASRDRQEPRSASGQRLELPGVKIVDMRLELQQGNTEIFSRELMQRLHATLHAREQAILFLNRRGTSTFVQCRACGHVETCPYCDIPLCYHGDRRQIICHRCNERQLPPVECPVCASDAIGYYGTGTQRIEREVKRLLPAARVLRWDQDALRGGVSHQDLMRKVTQHEVDIVVGTQMVAKGLDFPLVSLIGVINADTLLHLPDFRSAERSFQLLTQVAGRAGRRTSGAQVVIQSFTVDHYAVQTASRHDYAGFYTEEIAFRRHHGYPPFRRLVRLVYRHPDESTCQAVCEEMAELLARTAYLRRFSDVDLLGPTPAFTARVRGRYQWQIILRGDDAHRLASSLDFDPGWLVDVDPVSLL